MLGEARAVGFDVARHLVIKLERTSDDVQFSATKSSGALGTSMAALGLVIAWVDSHFLTDRLTVNHEQELREKNCF